MCSCLYRILLRKKHKKYTQILCRYYTYTLAFRQRNKSFKQLHVLMLFSYTKTV